MAELKMERRSFDFRYRSAQHFVDYFKGYYGPTLKAFEAPDAEGGKRAGAGYDRTHRSFQRLGR